MNDAQHQFEPLEATQNIPVSWELDRNDIEKLRIGNDDSRNHWHWYMELNTVHIYKGFGGIEHYRFTVRQKTPEKYVVGSLETHLAPKASERAELTDNTDEESNQGLTQYQSYAIEDVASMFDYFFKINVDGKTRRY